MALTPEQFERLRQLTLERRGQGIDVATEPSADAGGFIRETAGDIKETFTGVGEELFSAGEQIVETAQDKDLTLGERARGVGAEAFRGASRAFGEAVVGAGKAVLPQSAEDKASAIVQELGTTIGKKQVVKDLVGQYNALSPDTKRDVDNALGFAEGLGEILTFGGASRLTKPVLKVAIEAVEQANKATVRATKTVAATAVKGISIATPRVATRTIQTFRRNLNPKNKAEASKVLNDAYNSAALTDNKAVKKALDKQAASRSFEGKTVTKESLINDLVQADVFPTVEGKLMSFTDELKRLSGEQDKLAKLIDPVLETVVEKTSLDSLRSGSLRSLRASPLIVEALPQAEKELLRFFKSFEQKFGSSLSAKQVRAVQTAMNKRTKAFGEEAFKQDVANLIASQARKRIDELAPSGNVKSANAEWGRLQQLQNTARILDGNKVGISSLGEALGRWTGVVTLGFSGLGFAVGGPGGLVIASLAAKFGGDAVAQFLRNSKFSLKARRIMVESIKANDDIAQALVREADEANKALLERLLLGPGPIIAGSRTGVSEVRAVSAPIATPERALIPARTPVIELPQAQLGEGPGSRRTGPLGKGAIPAKLESLADEAKKFKTAEEFVDSFSKPKEVNVAKLESSEPLQRFGEFETKSTKPIDVLLDIDTGIMTIEDGHNRVFQAKRDGVKILNANIKVIKTDPVESGLAEVLDKSQLTDFFNKAK